MKRLLLGNFKKNLKKFEMYSDENVFSEKSQATRESSASSSEQDIAELQRLRAEFDSERDTYELLTAQKAALGPLLRAMQTSLFELRVAGQIVDSLNLHPLADSVAALSQQVAALEDLCAKSEGTILPCHMDDARLLNLNQLYVSLSLNCQYSRNSSK
jgi:hypothetical protein